VLAARGLRARDEMMARYADAILEPFPMVNPRESLSVKDRVVVLPPVPPSRWHDWIGRKMLAAGNEFLGGWYFAHEDNSGLARVIRAVRRYEKATWTSLGDPPYAIIARLTGDSSVCHIGGVIILGLTVDILGALVGDRVFVDATHVIDGESPFIGESTR
jgi:hypothetical protein